MIQVKEWPCPFKFEIIFGNATGGIAVSKLCGVGHNSNLYQTVNLSQLFSLASLLVRAHKSETFVMGCF